MEKVNLKLHYLGFFVLLVGIMLNIKMYFFDEWPTYLFFGLSLLGILLIGISFFKEKLDNSQ